MNIHRKLKALNKLLGNDKSKGFLVNNTFGFAAIAAGSLLLYIKSDYPSIHGRKITRIF